MSELFCDSWGWSYSVYFVVVLYLCIVSRMSGLFCDSWGWSYSVYFVVVLHIPVYCLQDVGVVLWLVGLVVLRVLCCSIPVYCLQDVWVVLWLVGLVILRVLEQDLVHVCGRVLVDTLLHMGGTHCLPCRTINNWMAVKYTVCTTVAKGERGLAL